MWDKSISHRNVHLSYMKSNFTLCKTVSLTCGARCIDERWRLQQKFLKTWKQRSLLHPMVIAVINDIKQLHGSSHSWQPKSNSGKEDIWTNVTWFTEQIDQIISSAIENWVEMTASMQDLEAQRLVLLILELCVRKNHRRRAKMKFSKDVGYLHNVVLIWSHWQKTSEVA